jgi:class 3 adenylate cyclase
MLPFTNQAGIHDAQNVSEAIVSTSSRLAVVPGTDIESIFPMNVAPWVNGQDAKSLSQYSRPPHFRFEYGMQLIPWRMRILFGLHSYNIHSAKQLKWDDVGYDKLNRKSVWRKFGQTLHFFTLEFADVSLEKGYQLDYARRSMVYVQMSGVIVALISALIYAKSIQDNPVSGCSLSESVISEPLFYMMLVGITRSTSTLSIRFNGPYRDWVLSNFQLFQFLWAILAIIACLVPFYFSPYPDCVGSSGGEAVTFSVLIILVAVFYRLRFIYLLGIITSATLFLLCVRWSSAYSGMNGPMDPIIMAASCFGSLIMVYMVEVMLRKDFVQTLAVTSESQRSDRLLRNVLPKRIIDILKKRQDAGGTGAANASTLGGTVGPGATALFTRAGNPSNSTWLAKPETNFQTNASRFESRIDRTGNALANTAIAEAFDSVTILFADVVGFTKISARVSPEQLVLLLNELFTVFDNIADQNGLEKVKTIGDAYMSAGGLPTPHPLHAHAAARMGLQMLEAVEMFCDDQGNPLLLRIGMHSGSCVAGVIGRRKFIYDVWGDCVNTASRMESHGEPMKVHCSQQTAERIQLDFELQFRGEMDIKGKGKMSTYFVQSEMPHSRYRSVLPQDIGQWRDRFTSERGSMGPITEGGEKEIGGLVTQEPPVETDDDDDEVF